MKEVRIICIRKVDYKDYEPEKEDIYEDDYLDDENDVFEKDFYICHECGARKHKYNESYEYCGLNGFRVVWECPNGC